MSYSFPQDQLTIGANEVEMYRDDPTLGGPYDLMNCMEYNDKYKCISRSRICISGISDIKPLCLTESINDNYFPAWSPDGSQIAYVSSRDGLYEIYVMSPDGDNGMRLTDISQDRYYSLSWSPEGEEIAFAQQTAEEKDREICVMDIASSAIECLTNNSVYDDQPSWSPDGEWISYISNVDGQHQVFIMKADGTEQRQLTDEDSNHGYPMWRPLEQTSSLSKPQQPTQKPTGEAPSVAEQADGPQPCTEIGQAWVSPVDSMEMVCVPEGEFLFGAGDDDPYARESEKPQRVEYLDAFWIDKTEVTNNMFVKYLNEIYDNISLEISGDGEITTLYYENNIIAELLDNNPNEYGRKDPKEIINSQFVVTPDYGEHPVTKVPWYGADAYCEWAGRSLPDEFEWEKAARGTDGHVYPWGNQEPTGSLANFADRNISGWILWADKSINDGYAITAPVGNYTDGASPYGALDMAGNVEEWVIIPHGIYEGTELILKHAGIEKYPHYAIEGLRGGLGMINLKISARQLLLLER